MEKSLKEKIKDDNAFCNFLKIPEEIINERSDRKELEQIDERIFYYLTEEYIKDCYKPQFWSILRNIFYIIKPIISRRTQLKLRKKYLFFQKKK